MSIPSSELKLKLQDEIVRAGAGTGKTYTLINKVLSVAENYFLEFDRAPRIIVTTFTRKATEELRERLLAKACESKDARMIEFVTSPKNLHISTIHGVLSLFLRRFGHLLNIDSGFSFIENSQAMNIARKIVRDEIVKNDFYEILLEDYSVEQLAQMAISFSKIKDEHGEISIFTEADIADSINAIIKIEVTKLAEVANQIINTTQKSDWIDYLNLIKSFQLDVERISEVSKPRFMTKNPPFSEDLHNELKGVLAKIKEFRGEEFKLENAALFEDRSRLFFEFAEEFYSSFYDYKMNLSQIEMADLETLTLKSIQNHPEVAVAFSSDWDFWLIDEFQDTSPMQITLLKSLIGSRPRFIVGDPQQSIYLFRGARNEVFSQEEINIVENDGLLKKLTTNYRSQPELLLFFNQFFSQFDEPFMKLDPKPNLASTHTNGSDSIPRAVDNCVANFFIIPKFEKDESADEDSSEVNYPNLDRASSIYSPISKLIIEGVQSGKRFDDYCVLSRTNSELKQIAQAFEQLNIPVQVHSNDSYYQRREILDLLSLLKFLLNPHDNLNFVRLVRSPWLRISDQIIVNNVASRPISYWESLRTAESKNPMIVKLIDILQRSQESGLFYSLFDFALNEGLIDSSHCHDSTGRRESNIWKFFDILRDEEKTPGFNFMDFAHRTLTEKRSDDENEESDATPVVEPNRVNLMTIHKSKGLKFNNVILPNIHKRLRTTEINQHKNPIAFDDELKKFSVFMKLGEDRKFTHNLLAQEIFHKFSLREQQEHLRLLYVAMTRAAETVTLHLQEPIQNSSWASLLKWQLVEGVVKSDAFNYKVQRGLVSVNAFMNEKAERADVRHIWADEKKSASDIRRISVTRFLSDYSKNNNEQVSTDLKLNSEKLKKTLHQPVIGQKIHMLFQRLKYNNTLDMTSFLQKWFGAEANSYASSFKYVLNLNEPPMKKLIEVGEVEWGFQFQAGDGVLEGQIDLWGIVTGPENLNPTCWVIDYKSGSSNYSDKAFDQLRLYSYVLAQHGVTAPIKMAVVYVLEKKIEVRDFQENVELRSVSILQSDYFKKFMGSKSQINT